MDRIEARTVVLDLEPDRGPRGVKVVTGPCAGRVASTTAMLATRRGYNPTAQSGVKVCVSGAI